MTIHRFAKSALAMFLMAMILMSCQMAFAVQTNAHCENYITVSGDATFLVYENGRILGALSPTEDIPVVPYQETTHAYPVWIRQNEALRAHAWTRVTLDEDFYVIHGGTNMHVTIVITDKETVESIIGCEAATEAIIDATIYSPDVCSPSACAAHMFFPRKLREWQVGTIYFANGSALGLWCGDWDGDGVKELGYVPLVREENCPGCTCGKCNCKSDGECHCTCTTCQCKKPETPKPTPKKQTKTKCCQSGLKINLSLCMSVKMCVSVGVSGIKCH